MRRIPVEATASSVSAEMLAELNRKPSLTRDDYRKAVELLLPTAQSDTGGSEPAAMVLLSAYNGHAWKISLPALCNLDWKHYDAVMTVIAGRTELRHEPHELIENGSEIFKQLCRQWRYLNQFADELDSEAP